MKTLMIKDRIVGDGYPSYIIAEIGINHNGDVSLAKEMVAAAWDSGADAVKLQTFITKEFLHPNHPGYLYDIEAEISHEKEQEIWTFAKQNGINIFSTPEDYKSLAFVAKQNPQIIKIAAMDFNFQDFIKHAASLQKPIILSSGMSTLEEVLQTVRWVEEAGNFNYALLHCVSCYPAPAHTCNLSVINKLKNIINCPIGFSDHTLGIHLSIAAVALGANIIEKHFTLDKSFPGPDQHCSMDPTDLKNLVRFIREVETSFGHGRKEPMAEEQEPRLFKRRGIYASHDLSAGSVLSDSDVIFFAPSHEGSIVTDWPYIKHRTLKKPIHKMHPIYLNDVI
jgi:N,N'-diacetyllegionaminate synthase